MAATRLSQWMRDNILRAIIKHAFGAREEALQARKLALADAIYNHLYSPEVLAVMKSLPPGFLPHSSSVKVRWSDDRPGAYGAMSFNAPESEMRIMGYNHNQFAVTFAAGDPLDDLHHALDRDEDALKEEKLQATRNAKAVLASVTTVKRLIEVWPEVESFAKQYLNYGSSSSGGSSSRALVVPLATLNQALGLPPQ